MGASQRRKGATWERDVANMLREAMPGAHVQRGQQSWDKSTDPDIRCPYFAVECKVGATPPIRQGMRQAVETAGDRWPIVVSRRNTPAFEKAEDWVTMRMEDWQQLVRQWWDAFGEREWVSEDTDSKVARCLRDISADEMDRR